MNAPRLTIFRKGLLLVGLPVAAQLVFLGFLLRVQNASSDAEYWAIHTKEVIGQAETAYRHVVETLGRLRAATLEDDLAIGASIPKARSSVNAQLQALERLVNDNPTQRLRVAAFRADADRLLEWAQARYAQLSARKSGSKAAILRDPDAEQLSVDLDVALNEILNEEKRLDAVRLERTAHLRRQAYLFLGLASLMTVVMAGLALWVFSRGIAARMARLAENAARLADRKPLLLSVGGNDEIGAVDAAFAEAARRLSEAQELESSHRSEMEARAAELAASNSELARANEELRFKTQENETFVYSVSHDLRSPLVNLQGFSKELSHACRELRAAATAPEVPDSAGSRLRELIDGEIMDSVRFIQTAVSRAARIIDSLLRLSRAGRVEYKRQTVDVQAVVEKVVESLRSTSRERKAHISISLDLPPAEADPSAVEQIFGNLLVNAVNYLDPGRPGDIQIGVLPPNGDPEVVRYFVRDNGLGIPSAYLPKLFTAFQRLHGQVAPGEGIGLALVRRVTERLGGRVTAESTEGVGSTFIVELPRAVSGDPTPAEVN